jgi:hypothetical protein
LFLQPRVCQNAQSCLEGSVPFKFLSSGACLAGLFSSGRAIKICLYYAGQKTAIIWGPMAQHGIIFNFSMLGDVSHCMSNKIVFYLKHDPTYKVILSLNTKSSAEGHLLALVKKTLASNSIGGDTIPLTGNSGLMMKNWLVALFLGSILSDVSTL